MHRYARILCPKEQSTPRAERTDPPVTRSSAPRGAGSSRRCRGARTAATLRFRQVLVQMKGFTKLEDSGRARGPIQELISIWGLSTVVGQRNTQGGQDTAGSLYTMDHTVSTQEQEVLPSHKLRSKRKVTSSYRLFRGKRPILQVLSAGETCDC